MKARMSIKIALFAALSAIACTIANLFVGLLEIVYIAEVLWFSAYVSTIVWLCKYVGAVKKVGKNLVVSFFTFALAVYLGAYYGFSEDALISVYAELAFYAMALICLGSVVLLIGRWVFGKAPQEEKTEPEQTEQITENVLDESKWVCVCGKENAGKFCSECGSAKPQKNGDCESQVN